MDPFDRWSQQRLLEEVATNEGRGDGPASRGGRSIAAAILLTVVFVIAVLVTLAGRVADEPASAPTATAAAGASIEVGDVVG